MSQDQDQVRPVVLKIGGGELDSPEFMTELADTVAALQEAGEAIVVVHGGGKTIAEWQTAVGLQPEFIDGLRVTTEASLAVAEMVLSGTLNKRLVRSLGNRGLAAVGISGVDSATVQVTPLQSPKGDLGRVGDVTGVDLSLISLLLGDGRIPVISPISVCPEDGLHYNVNADHVAMAVAAALPANRLVFLTNVPGVQIAGRPVRAMTAEQARTWIEEGHIRDGMVVKVQSALEAIGRGVLQAVITDLAGIRSGTGTGVLHADNVQR